MPRESTAGKVVEGIGLLAGMIIGAGMFALPYSFSRAGFLWSLFLFGLVFAVSLLLHLLYDAIIYATSGRHRFPGYVKLYLGKDAERLAFIFTILSVYGTMLAYGILGALFIENISGLPSGWGGLLFFIAGGVLFFLSLRTVGKLNFYLTLPLLLFIVVLAAKLSPHMSTFNFSSPLQPELFLPYGVLLFAFAGYSALPDLHDVLGERSRALSRRIIFISLVISAVFYLVFTLSVLGASGIETSQDAFSGLLGILGKSATSLGSVIGLLAVFTSYVVFGADLKLTFRYDYHLSSGLSWFLAFLPPVMLFSLGLTNLVKILSIVGAVGLGVFALLVLAMAWRLKEKIRLFLGFEPQAWWLFPLGALILAGVFSQLLPSPF